MRRFSKSMKASLAGLYPKTAEVNEMLVSVMNSTLNLSLRSREAHWNIKGPFFGPLHTLFGDFYDFLDGFVDTFAERLVQLDAVANTSPVGPTQAVEPHEYLATIFAGAQGLAEQVKADLENVANQDNLTQDILIEFGRELEKWLWKIESHLK